MVSEAQKAATKRYYAKVMADPEKKKHLMQQLKRYAENYKNKQTPEQRAAAIEKHREYSAKCYRKWSDDLRENDPDAYREYLYKSRIKYWFKKKQTMDAADFEKSLQKLSINNPDFHKKLVADLEKTA